MKIAVVGATGRAGSRIVEEALRRGHSVTAIARHLDGLAGQPNVVVRQVDAGDRAALAAALAGHDAVVSALRFAQSDLAALIEAVERSGVKRYVVVGGAGSLFVAPGRQLVDQPDFPVAYVRESRAGRDFLEALRGEPGLDWTFISPSAVFAPGERTGHFRTGGDDLLIDAAGRSTISMEDFAIAVLDELERPRHVRERFTVGY